MGDFLKNYVEVDYKGKMLKFYPLNNEDTFLFMEKWSGAPADFLKKNEAMLKEFIAKSLKINKKETEDVSAGFLMFGLENLMEAMDFPFLLKSSQRLTKKLLAILKEIEPTIKEVNETSLPELSEDSQEKKDGQQTLLSEDSQLKKQ
jgi:hypothetical protein